MKAMILAAGLGTRLRPLTLERAKPAIPLLGKPLLVRLLEKMTETGVNGFRINLHHLPASIEKIFETPPWDRLPVSFSREEKILGTAGGLKANERFFDSGTFLMANGDIIADFVLDEAITFHRERGALATLILYPQYPPFRYTPVRIDHEGRLMGFKGAGEGGDPRPETYLFTGIHIMEPELFEFVPPGVFCEINDQVYPAALRNGKRVYGFPVSGYWNDLGDPGRYLEAQRDLFIRGRIEPPVMMDPSAGADPSANMGPFVSAGPGCKLRERSRAENAILWDRVRLNRASSVINCIIGSDVTVEGRHANSIITLGGEVSLA